MQVFMPSLLQIGPVNWARCKWALLASRAETLVLAGSGEVAVVMAILLTAMPLLTRVMEMIYSHHTPASWHQAQRPQLLESNTVILLLASQAASYHIQLAGAAEGAVVPASSLTAMALLTGMMVIMHSLPLPGSW